RGGLTTMSREATLFEDAEGSVVRGYLLLKQRGANIPPNWLDRSCESRRNRHGAVVEALESGSVAGVLTLEEWELAYQKECFYYGLRCLLELERSGETEL